MFTKDLFQHNIIQIGIKNAVKIIINNAKPSTPKIQLIFTMSNQGLISINWKCVTVGSKKNNKEQQILKIISELNNPKLRIKI